MGAGHLSGGDGSFSDTVLPMLRFRVLDDGLCRFHFNNRVSEIHVCKPHEIVGSVDFARQESILNFGLVGTYVMFAASDPAVMAALKEFATANYEYMKHSFARAVQKSDVRMAIGVDDYGEVKNSLHMGGTGYGRVNWQPGFKSPNVRALRMLGDGKVRTADDCHGADQFPHVRFVVKSLPRTMTTAFAISV